MLSSSPLSIKYSLCVILWLQHLLVKRWEKHLSWDWLLRVAVLVENGSQQSDRFIFLRLWRELLNQKALGHLHYEVQSYWIVFSTLLNFRSSFKQLGKMAKKCAVGIDLGTTYSCVGEVRLYVYTKFWNDISMLFVCKSYFRLCSHEFCPNRWKSSPTTRATASLPPM